MNVREIASPAEWNTIAAALPGAHVLQSWEWGEFKSRYGWKPRRRVWEREGQPVAAASILRRTLSSQAFAARMNILYLPRGPLLDWSDSALVRAVLGDLEKLARREGAIFLKIDPDLPLATGLPGAADETLHPCGQAARADLLGLGWRFSPDQVQFRNTVQVDLTQDDEALLGRMKQKTRYNIRLAARKGVTVRQGNLSDLDLLYRLYAETSIRDSFVIRRPEYYRDAWGSFMQAGLAEALMAEVEGKAVAALIVYRFGGRAWFMYGMSSAVQREKMPNHLLQWEAMRRAKAAGCTVYDFWGAPDEFAESDSMWGVFKFKEGFGGQVVRTAGAWDYPASRPLYWLYTRAMPRVLDLMRVQGRRVTRELL